MVNAISDPGEQRFALRGLTSAVGGLIKVMSMRLCLVLVWAVTRSVWGADEKLPVLQAGGEVYSNVTVTTVSATDVFFTYDQGMGNVKLKDLSPALQKHFQYDPVRAKAVAQLHAAANAQYHSNLLNQAAPPAAAEAPADAPATGKQIWAKSFLNQHAPNLLVEKWLTATPEFRGKFVLLDFWATWCPPCRAAIPELNGYQQKFGDKLVVIGLSDESEEAVQKLESPKIEYAVAIDTQARTKSVVGVTGIPHVMLIDPQGIVRWEGFPFLKGYELNEQVIADIISRYGH